MHNAVARWLHQTLEVLPMLIRSLALLCFMLAMLHIGAPQQAFAQAPAIENGVTVGPVTGLPLPRFVSIRPTEANVRVGPGGAYAVLWTFMRSGLPVEITAEFGNWRKIRDMDGDEGWIRHDLLTGRRTAVIAPWSEGDPQPARRAPDSNANTRYLLEPGVLGELVGCDGQWCEVASLDNDISWAGFVRQTTIWGAYPDEAFEAN
ncbi:MAG: SH3 domain-containing protein [Hyphomicrobiales bacterium]